MSALRPGRPHRHQLPQLLGAKPLQESGAAATKEVGKLGRPNSHHARASINGNVIGKPIVTQKTIENTTKRAVDKRLIIESIPYINDLTKINTCPIQP